MEKAININYKGEFIDQVNLWRQTKNESLKNYSIVEREEIEQALFQKNLENRFQHINEITKDEKTTEVLLKYLSIIHSYNKNKGQWLEDILDYVFERVNLFEMSPKIHWEEDIILKKLSKAQFKINNKIIKPYDPIFLKDLLNLKTIKFTSFSKPEKYICNLLGLKNVLGISNIKGFNVESEDFLIYTYEIKLKETINISTLQVILEKIKLLSSYDLTKVKTDNTIEDHKGNVYILEVKNKDRSTLKIEDITKSLLYAVREKTFSGKKFKNLYIIYKGDLDEKLIKEMGKIQKNFYNATKTNLNLIKIENFLYIIKNKYFDDDTKKQYKKKDITCWDFNTITYKKDNINNRKYQPNFTIDNKNSMNTINIILDFQYKFKNDFKKNIINKNLETKRENEDKQIRGILLKNDTIK